MPEQTKTEIIMQKFITELRRERDVTITADKKGYVSITLNSLTGHRSYLLYSPYDNVLLPYRLSCTTGKRTRIELTYDIQTADRLKKSDPTKADYEIFWAILQPFVRFNRLAKKIKAEVAEVTDLYNTVLK